MRARWIRTVALVLSTSCGSGTAEKVEQSSEAISAGSPDDTDTATVLVVLKAGTQVGYCSGVVVSPHVVLTAAHCTTLKGKYSIYLAADHNDTAAAHLPDNYIDVVEQHAHPKYDSTRNTSDVGVLITGAPIPRTPVAINHQAMGPRSVGQSIRIVGYGQTSSDTTSFGRRHQGTAAIAAYDAQTLTVTGTPNICLYDSGGPTLITQNGTDVVAGIHYLVDSTDCNSQGFDMRADVFADFVDGYIASADPPGDAGASDAAAPPSDGDLGGAKSSSGCAMGGGGHDASSGIFVALAGAVVLRRSMLRGRRSRV